MGTTHEYPPAAWSTEAIQASLRHRPTSYPLPRYEDASAWERIRERDQTKGLLEAVREHAASVAEQPVVPITASGYLEYAREGTRGGFPMRQRSRNLGALVVAECIDREGRYQDAILDHLWAMCEQATWTRPAHLGGTAEYLNGLPRPVSAGDRQIALQTAISAKFLAEARYVMGAELHPAVRERIVTEIDDRVLTAFLARDDFSWQTPPTANHNAVCNGSILIAALHAEPDVERTAAIVRKAAANMRHYLAEFGVDGATSEGIGYWKFGMSFYTKAARHLEERTAGDFSLFSPPIVEQIASFPLQIELSPNRYPAFSDASEREDVTPYLACALGQRFDLPTLSARGWDALAKRRSVGYFSSILRNLSWCAEPATDSSPVRPSRAYFSGHEWWLARYDESDPGGLVVAAKGGHNDEAHNHNDCGSFVVHYDRESLLTDPGSGTYVDGYFGEDRYDFFANRSLAHSVPTVNGYEQSAGQNFSATVLDQESASDRDRFRLDLAGCYPAEAGVQRLVREFELDRTRRTTGAVHLRDTASFAESAPGEDLTSVLIAAVPMRSDDGALLIDGDRASARVEPSQRVELSVEHLENAVSDRDIWRATVTPAASESSQQIDLAIRPRTDTR